MTRKTPPARCLFVLVVALSGQASAREPWLVWHVLETPHFRVHFYDGLYPLALRAGRLLEQAHERLSPLLGHAPAEPTLVVLSDDMDSANGMASAFLRPEIGLLADAPDNLSELSGFDDHVNILIVHEYTHVLHLDRVGGIPAGFNRVFGTLLNPNAYQPKWFVEGLAVFEESNLGQAGRIRFALMDAVLRAQWLAGRTLRLDQATHAPRRYPRGTTPYLYGGRFVNWLAQRFGEEKLAEISRNYGSRLVPYALNTVAEQELGKGYVELFREWTARLGHGYDAQLARVRASGATQPVPLTHFGEGTGLARFSPAGDRLYYAAAPTDRHPQLRSMRPDGADDRWEADVVGVEGIATRPDGAALVLSQVEVWREFSVFEDLYTLDLETHRLRRRTFGLRATEPDVSADGRWVACVARAGGGATRLLVLDDEFRVARVLYEPAANGRLYTPRFSPDGRTLAFSEARPTGRDVRLVDVDSGAVRDVTNDGAMDLEPSWDPSGQVLYFASDRDGIFNVYAHDLAESRTWRVTNALTGLFRPEVSPDSKAMTVSTLSERGFDVGRVALDRATWVPADAPPPPRKAPEAPPFVTWPVAPYSALETLAPRYWLPFTGADAGGAVLGIATGGSDIVGRHSWSLQGWWGLTSHEPGFEASYQNRFFYPALSLSVGRSMGSIPGGPSGSFERAVHATATMSAAVSAVERSQAFSLSYDYRYLWPELPYVKPTPDGPLPFAPERGAIATLALGWAYNSARRYPDSVSAEEGMYVAVTVRASRPEWGGNFSYAAAEAAASTYLKAPWLSHHVLALRLAGGAGLGDLGRRRVYSLGGLTVRDPILDLLYGGRSAAVALRGYRPGATAGNAFALANAEYRFPVWEMEWGPWSLPVYLRRIHGAVFADAGTAADRPSLHDLRAGVGAEIRLEFTLGYYLTTDLRLGFARGLVQDGINDPYFSLGGQF